MENMVRLFNAMAAQTAMDIGACLVGGNDQAMVMWPGHRTVLSMTAFDALMAWQEYWGDVAPYTLPAESVGVWIENVHRGVRPPNGLGE